MARHSTVAMGKLQDAFLMSRIAGIMALGLSLLLEALAVTPFASTPQILAAPLLLAAVVQIASGLKCWRHERILEAVVLIAFGLFACSQISRFGTSSTLAASPLGEGAFLLFWGVFAALIAAQSSDCGRSFHLLLAAAATTIFAKALIVLLSMPLLWPLPLFAGVLTLALAILTGLRLLPVLRS